MTLRNLEEQGLLVLPSNDSWEEERPGKRIHYKGSIKNLRLVYVNVWGKVWNDEDNNFLLKCIDDAGNYYSSEITNISDDVSRFFLSVFCVEHYGEGVEEIFTQNLTVTDSLVTLFKKRPALRGAQ